MKGLHLCQPARHAKAVLRKLQTCFADRQDAGSTRVALNWVDASRAMEYPVNGGFDCTGAALAFKDRHMTKVRQDDTDGKTGNFPLKKGQMDFTSLALPHGNSK